MILIGSRALWFWNRGYKEKVESDWDVVATPQEAESFIDKPIDHSDLSWKYGDIEFHNANALNNNDIQSLYGASEIITCGDGIYFDICNLRGLAAIKRSHLHRKLNFAKHMIHYQLMDHNFDEGDHAFIERRKELTKLAFPERIGSKNKNNKDFFKGAVTRVFNHDDIHKIVAGDSEPMYLKVKKDMSSAAYDNDLWNGLSADDKVKSVQEECYVIAIERFLIPRNFKYPYKLAFYNALEKACTTLDNGPWREHAIDNWNTIKDFDSNVFNNFLNSKLWKDYANKNS